MSAPWQQDADQQPWAGGAYTSGGPAQGGSTYAQYTPQTFSQQNQAQAFGQPGQNQAAAQHAGSGQAVASSQGSSATPQSWTQQTAAWQQGAQTQVPTQAQGYGPTGYNPQGSTGVVAATAPPQFGGWNQNMPPSQPSAGNASPAGAIAQAYRQYLGREATQQEIQARLGDRNFNLQRHVQSIASSGEAQAYAERQRNQPPQGQPGQPPPQGQQPQQGGTQANSGANTDGYAPPRYIAQRPSGGPPPGWDAKKWSDPNHQTPKYVIGRILSQFSPRTQNMDAVVAEIARAYPGARRTGSGDITVPGVGSIDVLQAADVGGKAWQFGGLGGGKSSTPAGAQTGGYDPYAQMQQLMAQYGVGGPGRDASMAVQPPPEMMQEMEQMRQQLAAFQQRQTVQDQQAAAAATAARNRGPQFSYF